MAAIVAIAELARGLLSSDSSFVSAVSAPTDASIEASSNAPASLTSTPPTTVSPDNMSQISDADVSGKPDTVSVPSLESAIPLLENEQQNQARQQLQQEQQGAGQGIDAIVVVPQQPADPSLPAQQPVPDSTGRFLRRARGNNAPVYNLARLTGTYVHGKRASKGDIVLQKKRKPKGRKLQALLAQQALEAEQAAQQAAQGETPADPAANIPSAQPANQETDKPDSNAPADAPTIPPVHAPAAPEPAAPEPTIPEPTIPEPTIPEPTIPEPTIPEFAASPDKNGAAQPPDAPAEENRVDHESLDASMHEAPLEFPTDTAELSSTTKADTAQGINPNTSDALTPALPVDVPDHIPAIASSATTKPSTRGAKATKKDVVKRPVGRPKKRTATNAGKATRTALAETAKTATAEEIGTSTVDEAVISSPKDAVPNFEKEAEPSIEKEAEPSGTEDLQTGTWEDVPAETTGDVQTSPAKQVKAVKAKGIKTTKDKATKAGTIKASAVVPATRRATRHSGVPVEDPILQLITPAPGKKTKKTAEPAVTRVPRELKRLRDTNEFVGIETRPIRYSVWSNGKYVDVTEEKEPTAPAKKKAKVESSTATVREDKKDKTVEPEAPMNTDSPRPVVKQKRVKKWLNKGLYAGQQAPEDVIKSLTTQERKRLLTIPELAKSGPPNKVLPLPIFNGLRLLITGRDFKLPFDVCHPLPPGQPKPAAYRTMTKNRFIGQAAAIWKKTPHFEDFASKCVCMPEDGCAQDCQNRVMLYECDETNCNVGKQFCQNRAFQMLTERTKKGGRYRIGVEVFKTEDRGYGVRSNRCFEPHQIIMEYTGEIITDEECERRMNEEYKNNECYYLMSFDQNMIIDATTGSIARFVNHSCSPNCRMIKWIVSGQPRMALFAGDRPIQTGEELTYDYNFDPFSAKNVQKCLCGAPNCRGVLGPKPKEVKPPKPPKAEVKGKKKAAKRKLQELLADNAVEGEGKSPKKLKVGKAQAGRATKDTAKGAPTFVSRKVSKVSVSAKSKVASAKTTKTFTRKVSIATTRVVKSYSKKGAAAKSKMITLKAPSRGSSLTIVAADAAGSITAAGTTGAEEEVGNKASKTARLTPKNTPRAKKTAEAVQNTPATAEGDRGSIFDVPSSSSARKRAPSWKVRDSGVKNVSSLFKKARKSPVKSKDTASPAATKVVKPRKAITKAKVTKPGKAMPKLTVAKKTGKSVAKPAVSKSGKGSVGTKGAAKIRLVSKPADGQDENAAPKLVE
ncbi:hypothetical protein N0V85_001064 [Neurospora sp. IMI 360204]|nr:hypothetical protein N0V85_001064 [Neurospora sp. IMI 360204]